MSNLTDEEYKRRSPRDGKPFYCVKCGAGWDEYGACDLPDCELEAEAVAKLRVEESAE